MSLDIRRKPTKRNKNHGAISIALSISHVGVGNTIFSSSLYLFSAIFLATYARAVTWTFSYSSCDVPTILPSLTSLASTPSAQCRLAEELVITFPAPLTAGVSWSKPLSRSLSSIFAKRTRARIPGTLWTLWVCVLTQRHWPWSSLAMVICVPGFIDLSSIFGPTRKLQIYLFSHRSVPRASQVFWYFCFCFL